MGVFEGGLAGEFEVPVEGSEVFFSMLKSFGSYLPLSEHRPALPITSLAEGSEEMFEEDLGFAFLVALDVLRGPGDEVGELLFACVVAHWVEGNRTRV